MGHKTHPIGFRLGVDAGNGQMVKDWQAHWFAPHAKQYRTQLLEDVAIRRVILSQYQEAGISRVEIDRSAQDITVNVHTARPGIVIGRGGARVEELRKAVESAAGGKRVRLNILEIRQPELDAFLVARNIADQLERRVAFRRALRQGATRTMQAGAQGVRIVVAGRLGGAEIARREKIMEGRVPLHTLRADIDFAVAEAHTVMGRIGIKAWVYRGEILRRRPAPETQAAGPATPRTTEGRDAPAEAH